MWHPSAPSGQSVLCFGPCAIIRGASIRTLGQQIVRFHPENGLFVRCRSSGDKPKVVESGSADETTVNWRFKWHSVTTSGWEAEGRGITLRKFLLGSSLSSSCPEVWLYTSHTNNTNSTSTWCSQYKDQPPRFPLGGLTVHWFKCCLVNCVVAAASSLNKPKWKYILNLRKPIRVHTYLNNDPRHWENKEFWFDDIFQKS